MEKIDFKKQLKHLYTPSAKKVEIVEVPQMNFLMVDGAGDPNTSKSFSDAIEALYPVFSRMLSTRTKNLTLINRISKLTKLFSA
ncbi:MAG: hypothetical protein Q7V04_08875 [Deltaproteobacteria bacterium]|nr:hypothetical protein [Deltaproteobacteria bacterium]